MVLAGVHIRFVAKKNYENPKLRAHINIFLVDPLIYVTKRLKSVQSCFYNFMRRNARHFSTFFSKFESNLMCHNLMRLWYTFQNDRSHRIVTHQVEIKF